MSLIFLVVSRLYAYLARKNSFHTSHKLINPIWIQQTGRQGTKRDTNPLLMTAFFLKRLAIFFHCLTWFRYASQVFCLVVIHKVRFVWLLVCIKQQLSQLGTTWFSTLMHKKKCPAYFQNICTSHFTVPSDCSQRYQNIKSQLCFIHQNSILHCSDYLTWNPVFLLLLYISKG